MTKTSKPLLEELTLGSGVKCVVFTTATTEREAELVRQAYEMGQKHVAKQPNPLDPRALPPA